jgi:hypothetical protein
MDVVYICRPGDDNEELRYSLRSLANIPHERVWVFGDGPVWLRNVEKVIVPRGRDKQDTALQNLITACQHPEVSDPFLIMNDDFYIMQPMERVPSWNMGPLTRVISEHREGSAYRIAMQKTYDRLLSLVDDPTGLVSYELHIPMEIDKVDMLMALSLGTGIHGLHNRTMYGNLSGVLSTEAEDVKVYRTDKRRTYPEWPLLSTSDRTFRYHPAGRYIRESFPQPSAYEFSRQSSARSRQAIRYHSVPTAQ